MGASVIPGYNPILLAASESAFNTAPTPADVAAYAALALSTIECRTGPVQAPVTRPKQDRGLGRDMQDGFVSGRYEPVPFSVVTSLKTRADADDAPRELALWKAAGLKRTVNSGVSYVLEPSATPIESGDFASATLTRLLGRSPGEMAMERLTGCVVDTVRLDGGDQEVKATFSGAAAKKVMGTGLDSITLADGSGTSLTVTAAESYALAPGYYVCESEIILVSEPSYGSTSVTIARAQLGTTGAAHSAKPLYPYVPAGIAYGGAPIPESLTTSCTFAGSAFRVLKWGVELKTGLAHLPGETGSAYTQGVKATRLDVTVSIDFLLKGDDVRKFNRARERTDTAVTLVQGTAAGGIITISIPYCELVAPEAQDNANDTITVSAQLRVRGDSAGNNCFAITLT